MLSKELKKLTNIDNHSQVPPIDRDGRLIFKVNLLFYIWRCSWDLDYSYLEFRVLISRPIRYITRGMAKGVVSAFTDDEQTQIIAGAAVATVAGLVTNVLLLDFAGKADTV